MKHVDRGKHLIQIIGRDDLHVRPEDLVAGSVIVVPMGVDDVSYRLVGELLDSSTKARAAAGEVPESTTRTSCR